MGIISGNYVINFPSCPGMICANTYSQLSGATLVAIYKVWNQSFGMVEDTHFVVDKQPLTGFKHKFERLKSYKNVISFSNGARIFLISLENYKAADGMEVGWALLDETKDTREEAVKEVILARLRSNKMFIDSDNTLYDYDPEGIDVKGFNPFYAFTSPAKVPWLNHMFYINDNMEEIKSKIFNHNDYYIGDFDDRRVVISSTYHNEHNLPNNYIESRRKIWDTTPGLTDMLIYASPVGKTGGEWYSQYQRDIHVVKGLEFDPDLPVHTAWDFNVNPYMPALAIQLGETPSGIPIIRVIKEYALKHPRNTTGDVCDEMNFDFAGIIHSIYVYGDSSGRNRVTALFGKDSPKHNYDVIKIKLAEYIFNGSMRVPKSNPPLAGRRIMMNNIFSHNHRVIIEIDEDCIQLIQDIDFGKEGPNGEYLKKKFKDPDTGKTFEKYGHHSDGLIYFCWYHFKHLIKT